MSDQPNMKMPKDSAQVVFWFKGLPQPTALYIVRCQASMTSRSVRVTHLWVGSRSRGRSKCGPCIDKMACWYLEGPTLMTNGVTPSREFQTSSRSGPSPSTRT